MNDETNKATVEIIIGETMTRKVAVISIKPIQLCTCEARVTRYIKDQQNPSLLAMYSQKNGRMQLEQYNVLKKYVLLCQLRKNR